MKTTPKPQKTTKVVASGMKANIAAVGVSATATLILAFFIVGNVGASESINYSKSTLIQQALLEETVLNFDLALEYQEDLEAQVLDARTNTAGIRQAVCAQTLVLAQLKFTDTPAHMTAERARLHDSANKARECSMSAF